MTRAQGLIVLFAGLLAAAPVAIPLTLARLCVPPFAAAIPSLSRSCPAPADAPEAPARTRGR